MVSDLEFDLGGSSQRIALGIQQLIKLGGLLASGCWLISTYNSRLTTNPVAMSLLPMGYGAAKPVGAVFQPHRASRFYDCCAAEREQAPSPQKPGCLPHYS
nr:hypothetical protein [Pseudomonas brassicacearum]